jgi:hypothetical protein
LSLPSAKSSTSYSAWAVCKTRQKVRLALAEGFKQSARFKLTSPPSSSWYVIATFLP